MIRVQTRDIVSLGKAKKTRENFLVADATFSRTGCQDYTRRELGLDGDPNELVTLYRPAEEVFAPGALASLDGKPLTLRHPPEDVTADNWKQYAVGDATGVRRSGETTVGKVTIRDAAAVRAYDAGTRELSVGYAFDLDMTSGTAPDGTAYQGVQRNIRGNHHAIVDEGRCGGECRVGDSARKATDCSCNKNTGDNMPTMRKITTADSKFSFLDAKGKEFLIPVLDIDLDVSTPEGAKAADAIDRFTRGIKDCMAAHDSVKAEVGVHKERADAAETRLKELDAMPEGDPDDDGDEDEDEGKDKKSKDSKVKLGDRATAYVARLAARAKAANDEKAIEGRVAARQATIAGSAKILGADFKPEGKSTKAIQVEALTSVLSKDGALKAIATASLGGVEPGKVSDEKLATAFSTVIAASGATGASDDRQVTDGERQVGQLLAGTGGSGEGGAKPTLVGRDALISKMFGGADAS